MDVSAKNAKIWRKDIEGKNGTFHKYTVSVSKKDMNGNYVNAYIPVVFSKKSGAPEKISNGVVCDFSGFMSVESFTDKEGKARTNPQIVIMEVEFADITEGVDSFEEAEEDMPF